MRKLLVCLLGNKFGECLVALGVGAAGEVLSNFGGQDAQILIGKLLRGFENLCHAFSPLRALLRWDFFFLVLSGALADALAGVFERLRADALGGT